MATTAVAVVAGVYDACPDTLFDKPSHHVSASVLVSIYSFLSLSTRLLC